MPMILSGKEIERRMGSDIFIGGSFRNEFDQS